MKATGLGAAALGVALIATTGLHAQRQDTKTGEPSSITVTGCLQPVGTDRSAVGTSGSSTAGSAGSASSASQFMLVNARVGHAPGGASGVTTVAPPGSGTNESAARAGATQPSAAIAGAVDKNGDTTTPAAMFVLRGNSPEMPRHVGQEVEVSGRLIQSSAAAGSSTSRPAATAGAGTQASAAPQEIDVQTLRMVASVCAAAK